MNAPLTAMAALVIAVGAHAADPTQPDTRPMRTSQATQFELNAVILGSLPRAFINGQEVIEGSQFSGYLVTLINSHEVLMSNDTRQIRLNIHADRQSAITPLEVLK